MRYRKYTSYTAKKRRDRARKKDWEEGGEADKIIESLQKKYSGRKKPDDLPF